MSIQRTEPFLSNDNVEIEASADRKYVFLKDLTDPNNEPRAYSESVRGVKETLAELEASFTDATTFVQAKDAFRAKGVKMHFWCAVD